MEGPTRWNTRNAIWPVQQASMLLLLLLSLVVMVGGLVGVEEVDKTCQSHETCMPNCKLFKEKLKLKNELQFGSQEREDLVNQIKSQVCNKKKQAFCCPCEDDPCVPTSDCPQALDLLDRRKRIQSSNPTAASQIISRLKANICSEKERRICCPLKGSEDLEEETFLEQKTDPGVAPLLPSLPKCGNREDNGAQIVGGKEAEEGEFPWAVLLGQTRRKKKRLNGKWIRYNETRWSCGGILITPRVVLTAAHCQGKSPGTKIQNVRLGEWRVAGQAQGIELPDQGEKLPPEQNFEIGPDDVIVHEEYGTVKQENARNIINDIAIIFLPRPAELNPGVQLVCLPHNPNEYRQELRVSNLVEDIIGKRPTVVGWGFTSGFDPYDLSVQGDLKENGVASKSLQKLAIPVLDPEECSVKFGGFKPISTQVCAGGELGKDSCKGDSGGGLYIQREQYRAWYLIGIVSFGSKKCGSGVPGIYTRVSEFIPWIEKKMLLRGL